MKFFTGAVAAGLITFIRAEHYAVTELVESRCKHAPTSAHPPQWHVSSESLTTVYPGSPVSYQISGVAESANPFIGVGDFVLLVQVEAVGMTSAGAPSGERARTEFELDLCSDVVGVECPLAAGDEFSGVVTWNAMAVPNDVVREDYVRIIAFQPEGPFCGHALSARHAVLDTPSEAKGDLLGDHLSVLIEEGNDDATWQRGHSPRFEGFSWDDARRIAGGTVMRGHLGFEDLPRRTYAKKIPTLSDATVGGESPVALLGRRRLTTNVDQDIPAIFDGRYAFPECASVIGRVRDQSDCGSCWAFASTEAFNDRRCIAGIGKGDGVTADQLSVLSAEDTTACCYGFHCGLSMGCNGGQPGSAWKWFTRTGVVTGGDYDDIGTGETCKPYEFMPCAHHVDPGASGYPACPDSEYPTPECLSECSDTEFNGGTYGEDKRKAKEAYSLGGVEDIQLDMLKYGSVTAAFSVYSDFLTYTGGVYSNKSGHYMGGHAVKIIGWGTDEDSGEDYWLVANSWNPSWGEDGLFRILRGVNECGIEGQIVAGEA